MLSLNSLTLFFHNRSPVDKTHAGLIDKWAAEVRRTGQPPTRTPTKSLCGDPPPNPSPANSSTAVSAKFKPRHPSRLSTSSGPTAFVDDPDDETAVVTARSAKSSEASFFLISHACKIWLIYPCSQVGVKIEDSMTTTTTQLSESGRQGRVHYTNRDLPPGSQDANVWRRVFIPTYIVFVANYSNPWSVKDKDALVALQHVWNTVYLNPKKNLGLAHTVEHQDSVFSIVRDMYEPVSCIDAFFRLISACMSGEQRSHHPPLLHSTTFSSPVLN
jgi:hypothetical protein